MANEHRHNDRVRVPLEVRWQGLSGKHQARVYDLSLGGCYIETLALVGVGERIVFQVATPNGGWLILHGVVRHVQPGMGFGLRFLELAPLTRQRLEAILEHARYG